MRTVSREVTEKGEITIGFCCGNCAEKKGNKCEYWNTDVLDKEYCKKFRLPYLGGDNGAVSRHNKKND